PFLVLDLGGGVTVCEAARVKDLVVALHPGTGILFLVTRIKKPILLNLLLFAYDSLVPGQGF
uniref:Uncharacterized protein n=1 Tax=Sus scrofa TaxID=9823 RepID=A0A4X1U9S4_PIG